MLQRVSINVEDRELEGVLHLAEGTALGGAAVLHGFGGHPEQPHIVTTCDALAKAGVAALRFAFRDHQPPRMTLASALADAAGAIRVLKAHPQVPNRLGVVGFSFGGSVAALVAGRDSRLRAAVLAAAPASFGNDPKWKPVAELSRTRARVLLIWGSRDTQVPFEEAERYAAVLSQARVTHRIVVIEGGDHDFNPGEARLKMASTSAGWLRESFA
ncbi:MAG TPA: alpha/beta family hydrolase [Candidatus Limnocylindria bacterium]|jgi:dienelactone hydrolase|nr:alpha/beta family hydrolase [Candidatus Limnocylindria bacterium]